MKRVKLTSFRTKTRAFSKKPPLSRNGAQDPSHYSSRRNNPEPEKKNLGNTERERKWKIFGDREREREIIENWEREERKCEREWHEV